MSREQLSYGLGRLAALARQRDWVTGEAAGLTPTQGDTLRLLADRPAGLRLGELAAHLSVRPSTASDVVAVLVAKELVRRLQGKVGALTTGSQRIDAALLAACPDLRIVANMAVGYNNFDLDAMTRAGVQGTNTPDVLTETTADFGFALLMATARRITESEHFLRAGHWKSWRYDMFAGAEVHGSRLGIIGMGRIGQGIAKRGAHGFGMNVVYHVCLRTGRPPARRATWARRNSCAPPTTWFWCCRTRRNRTTPSARQNLP